MPGGTQVLSESRSIFAYGTITLFGRLSHTFLLTDRFVTPMCRALQPRPSKLGRFGLIPVRSPLLGEYFLFLRVLRCFSSPGALHPVYIFNWRCYWIAVAGFPIRKSPDRSLYTATRGLSQCPTSFIGTWRQGIHRKLLVTYSCDAEKSKLLTLLYACLLSIYLCRHYSVGIVQANGVPKSSRPFSVVR